MRWNKKITYLLTLKNWIYDYILQGHRVKIRAPGQSGHGPSHIEQLRAQYIYFHKLTMLTVGPAGPCRAPKSRRAPGNLPPLPPSRRAWYSVRVINVSNEKINKNCEHYTILLLIVWIVKFWRVAHIQGEDGERVVKIVW